MTTMFLPAFSGREPTIDRRRSAAPEEMPTGTPSSRATRRALANGVLVGDRDDLVIDRGVEDRRHEAGADALDLVRAGLAAGQHRRCPPARPRRSGCRGLRGFSTWPTPVMVPPVPMPETKMSTSPSVSFQISSAVVRRWISGLAGFSNCCGMTAFGDRLRSAPRPWRWRPSCPSAPSVSTSSAPSSASILRRSTRHRLRHGEDQLVALGGGGEGERDAGVAGGRLDQRRLARRDLARRLQRLDHRDADAVLDAGDRVEEFELGEEVGDDALLPWRTCRAAPAACRRSSR